MVVKRGKKLLRSFQLVNVLNSSGCPTKFKPGHYVKSSAQGAANNAFNKLCNLKNIRGKCSLYVTIKDTTRGHSKHGKEYTYKAERVKLSEPVIRFEGSPNEFKILYKVNSDRVKNLNTIPKCNSSRKRTKGPMKSHSRRTNKRKTEEKKKRRQVRRKMGKRTPGRKRISVKKVSVNNNFNASSYRQNSSSNKQNSSNRQNSSNKNKK